MICDWYCGLFRWQAATPTGKQHGQRLERSACWYAICHVLSAACCACSGSCACRYVSTSAWDVIVPGDVTPGYSYCRHIREFFSLTPYWLLEPNDSLVTVVSGNGTGYALSNPAGIELAVYLTLSGAFDLAIPAGVWTGVWFDPRTAQMIPMNVTTLGNDTQKLTPPSFFDASSDVALHIQKSSGLA
jgi:hypothetical protein